MALTTKGLSIRIDAQIIPTFTSIADHINEDEPVFPETSMLTILLQSGHWGLFLGSP